MTNTTPPADDNATDAGLTGEWQALLERRGIACDEARRQRMAVAAPYLAQMRRRLREWRAVGAAFDERFDVEHGREQ